MQYLHRLVFKACSRAGLTCLSVKGVKLREKIKECRLNMMRVVYLGQNVVFEIDLSQFTSFSTHQQIVT